MVCSEILPEALSTCSERFSVWEVADIRFHEAVEQGDEQVRGGADAGGVAFRELFAFPVEIVAFVTAEGDDLLREQDERDGDGPFLHPCFAGRDAEEHIVVP